MTPHKSYKSAGLVFGMGILATIGRAVLYIIMLIGGVVLNIIIDNPLIVAGISFIANYIIASIRKK